MVQLIKMFCTFFQHADSSNEDYKEQFESLWECVIQQGGSLTNHPGLIDDRAIEIARASEPPRDVTNDDDVIAATEQIQSEMKAAFMLSGGHNATHKQLKGHLENAFVVGKEDKYPTNTVDLLSMMNNFRSITSYAPRQHTTRPTPGVDDGVNFMQHGEGEDKEDGKQQGATFIQKDRGILREG